MIRQAKETKEKLEGVRGREGGEVGEKTFRIGDEIETWSTRTTNTNDASQKVAKRKKEETKIL